MYTCTCGYIYMCLYALIFYQQLICWGVSLLYLYSAYASDPDQCIKDCQELLTDPKVDAALRTGDIYGLLITHHCHQQQHKEVSITCV